MMPFPSTLSETVYPDLRASTSPTMTYALVVGWLGEPGHNPQPPSAFWLLLMRWSAGSTLSSRLFCKVLDDFPARLNARRLSRFGRKRETVCSMQRYG